MHVFSTAETRLIEGWPRIRLIILFRRADIGPLTVVNLGGHLAVSYSREEQVTQGKSALGRADEQILMDQRDPRVDVVRAS